MNGPLRTAVEHQIAELTRGAKPEAVAAFAHAIRENVRRWEHRLGLDERAARWDMLDAWVARIVATENPQDPFLDERLAGCRRVCERLLRECGDAYVGRHLRRECVVTQLLGADRMLTCRHAANEAAKRGEAWWT